MNTFYEIRKNQDCLLVRRNAEYNFPLHFHLDLEIVLVKTGEVPVTVNGVDYCVKAGELLVVDSYDTHGYGKNKIDGDHCVLVVNNRYLSGWNLLRKDRALKTPLLQKATLVNELLSLVDAYLLPSNSETTIGAAVNLVLSRLADSVEFVEKKGKNERALVREILGFLQAHYREEISLKRVAKELGYTQEHISRVFHRFVKMSLSDYTNTLRLDYIDGLRIRGDERSGAELAFEAGFNSLQTYYRAKAKRQKNSQSID